LGFVGVLVGLAVGFGYRFWAARRAELAAAVVNTTLLAETARLLAAEAATREATLGELGEAWRDGRASLIVLMRPAEFERLSTAVASARRGATGDLERLAGRFDELTGPLWAEHQAFILAPFFKYLMGDTVSRKIGALLAAPAAEAVGESAEERGLDSASAEPDSTMPATRFTARTRRRRSP
jgi:hypothetical protein